jgi:hypothetical protein
MFGYELIRIASSSPMHLSSTKLTEAESEILQALEQHGSVTLVYRFATPHPK